jgi:hypothetical protein
MNAVSHCFPTAVSLLCLWHAKKAVLRHCHPNFLQDTDTAQGQQEWKEFYGKWHEIMASLTEETFEERLQQLKERYVPAHAREFGYIIETWLELYKEKLVKAWVDQYLHFGNVVTSRGEASISLSKSISTQINSISLRLGGLSSAQF